MSGIQPGGTFPSQREPLFESVSGKGQQVLNNAGGYVFKVDDLIRLQRFVIMGTDSGSYSVKEKDLKRENVACIDRLISDNRGVEAVQKLKDISVNRRNIKQDPLILAYAICARCNDKETKRAAYAILSEVCRIPTHLFMFIKFCQDESKTDSLDTVCEGTGWGRAHKRAVSKWYTGFVKEPERLARLVTKFKNRESWSHKDVLRLAHPSTDDKAVGFVLRYIVKGLDKAREMYIDNVIEMDDETAKDLEKLAELIKVFDTAVQCTDVQHLCYMIREHKLTWEQCNSDLLKSKEVWIALLPHMPIEATVRNLGRMTSYGLFAINSEDEQMVLEKILSINTPDGALVKTKVEEKMEVDVEMEGQRVVRPKMKNILHPFKILLALITYKAGKGDKGKLSWVPNQNIVKALDAAFYQAFEAVEPTGKKFYLAVDVSGSMSQPVLGSNNIHCSTAAAAMMMVTARTEENCIIKGFSYELKDLGIDRQDSIARVEKKMNGMSMGATDCAKPMTDAMERKIKDIDIFVVYTDNETWFGKIHPSEALRQYRMYAGKPDAKLAVCGMCASRFSIADPEDPNMLDVVGFDSAAPRIISEFAMGNI